MSFQSIDDLRRKQDDDQKHADTEEFQQGGHQSGTAVLRPVKGSSNDVEAIIKSAQKQAQAGMGPVGNRACVITLYRNGFRIGDGEFRDLTDPNNAAFLQAIKRGEIPSELEEKIRAEVGTGAQDVGVGLVDKSSEDFVPEVPAFQPFQGQGFSMGRSGIASDFGQAQAREAVLDSNLPSTTVQIVTHDGRRHRLSLNHQHTVLDLYQHVMFLTGDSNPFDLLGGFPPKPLVNPSADLKSAGLLGACVRQKLAQ